MATTRTHPLRHGVKPSVTATAVWRYGRPAIALHWLLALLLAFMAALGWWMMTIERTPQGPWFRQLHESIGVIVLALAAIRLLWRAGHRPRELPDTVPAWQVKVSNLVQWLLYLCMVIIPLTGLYGAAHSRAGVKAFGNTVTFGAVANRDTAEQFFTIHSVLVWVLVALAALHVLAALKHLLIDRDQVFQRMWFRRRA